MVLIWPPCLASTSPWYPPSTGRPAVRTKLRAPAAGAILEWDKLAVLQAGVAVVTSRDGVQDEPDSRAASHELLSAFSSGRCTATEWARFLARATGRSVRQGRQDAHADSCQPSSDGDPPGELGAGSGGRQTSGRYRTVDLVCAPARAKQEAAGGDIRCLRGRALPPSPRLVSPVVQ